MKRHAFTLVELLVVITIIGMLMGLLLPAVQQAREAGRRTQCANNIKNLALGCLTVETLTGRLPSGGWGHDFVGDPDRGNGKKQSGSWIFAILPQLEQENLFNSGRDDAPDDLTSTQKEGAGKVCKTPLNVITCPSRRPAVTYPYLSSASTFKNATVTKGSDSVARSDYAACGGSGAEVEISGVPGDYVAAKGYEKNKNWPERESNGLMYHHSAVQVGLVYDGMSNTYLIGEKYLDPDNYDTGKDGGDNECFCSGYDNDNSRTCYWETETKNRRPMQDRPGLGDTLRFGSAHAGILCMAMGDGSTHWVPYNIDPLIHSYLAGRNDRQNAALPQ